MAVRQADRTNIGAVVSQSVAGDSIVLKAYPDPVANPYTTLPLKAGVTYIAEDWVTDRVLKGTTGYRGKDMGVRITTALSTSVPDVQLFGVYHDTSQALTINAFLVQSNGVKAYDSAFYHRRVDGGRQIGITVQNNATGFSLVRCRFSGTGQVGTQFDHALYLKTPFGWTVTDTIIQDGGYFPLHLYPYARNGLVNRTVVYGGQRAVTFSGENLRTNTSVGLPANGGQWGDGFYVSEGNQLKNVILWSRSGNVLETWTPNASRPVRSNSVTDALVFPGTVIPGSLPGVALSGIKVATLPLNPGFKNPAVGDFTREGVYDGYGPPQLFGASAPPPPPPPPPPDPTVDPRIAQYEQQLATIKTKLALSQVQAGEARDITDALTQAITQLRTRVVTINTATNEALATYPS